MPIEAIALPETSPLVARGVPDEVKQISSSNASRRVAAANAASEMDLTKIERDFLREILQEQAESHRIEEGAQEAEWHLFMKNLSPPTPIDSNDMKEHGSPKEGNRSSGNSEWDLLLDRLSQMESPILQHILGHVEFNVLQGMLRFMHLRMIRDDPRGTHCEESITLPKKEVPVNDPFNEPVPKEPGTMQSVQELDLPNQMDSNTKTVTKEIPISEKQHGTMDWPCWPQESKPQHRQSTCYFWSESGEQAKGEPLGNSSHKVESKLEGTLQEFQQQLTPPSLLPALFPISERGESDEEGIFEQLEENMELETQSGSQESALRGLKPLPENLLSKLSPQGESDQEEVYVELPQHPKSKPEPEPGSEESHTGKGLPCSQQIESKLAEIPSQIASTLFMRNPLIMDLNVLHQLFRQIDQILFQVMPQQLLFDSVHPKQIKAHVHWHVTPDCSFRRYLDDGLEHSDVNQLQVLNPQHRHQFQSAEIHGNLQQTPQLNEFASGLGRTDLNQMPCQGNQSLDCQDLDSNNLSCQDSPCLWSARLEYSAAAPKHLQLLPEFMLDSTFSESLRYPKLDAMSFICSHVDGTRHPQIIVREPPSSTHRFLLDKMPQPEMIDELSLPQIDSDRNKSQLLPSFDELLSEICPGNYSSHDMCMGLPQEEHQQQIRKLLPSKTDTDLVHLLHQEHQQQQIQKHIPPQTHTDLVLPQECIKFPFQQMGPVELDALRQKMCLTVLQQIAKQVEYNISQGLPLEINAGLLEALDLQPEDYWLQPSGQETEPSHHYFNHHPDESWDVQEVDLDSAGCPETSQNTENSNKLTQLHEDMRQTLESSTSGSTTDPSETDSPLYHMADPVRRVYHRHCTHKDRNVDSLVLPIPHGKFFDEFEEFLHIEELHALEAGMPLYTAPLDMLDNVRHRMDMVARRDDLEDGFERSPDYMSSLNLLWVPEQELQQQSQITQPEDDDEIGNTIDFYLKGLAGTASDLIWNLDPDESVQSAAALEDVAANDLPYDLGVSGDLQIDEDLSGSSAEHMLDSNEIEELFLEETDASSRSFQSQESETSTMSWDEANAQLEEVCCDCRQPQVREAAGLQDSHKRESQHRPQRRKSVGWAPQIASVLSISEPWGNESSPARNPDQNDDGRATSNPSVRTRNIHCDMGSEIPERTQMNGRGSQKQSSLGGGNGKPRQTTTSSSTEDCVEHQGASSSDSPKVNSSVVKLTNGSTSQGPPTMSQFHDPSTPVRHTIFGLLVLAGGLYLVENRDEIEQQSISAAEAAAEAWRWLGSFLLRMARGEFEN